MYVSLIPRILLLARLSKELVSAYPQRAHRRAVAQSAPPVQPLSCQPLRFAVWSRAGRPLEGRSSRYNCDLVRFVQGMTVWVLLCFCLDPCSARVWLMGERVNCSCLFDTRRRFSIVFGRGSPCCIADCLSQLQEGAG